MHTMSLLDKWLQRDAVMRHWARAHALKRVVGTLLSGRKLALTHLGRHRPDRTFVRHHIKPVDRWLGNRHLHGERDDVYGAVSKTVLGGVVRPVILVDWADSTLEHKQLILKAAVAVKGRAISIYEEVHPMRRYNNSETHRRFLWWLKSVLPERCRPIVVTDPGFRGPWFRDVEALGWNLVGRIRNRISYLKPATGRWCFIKFAAPSGHAAHAPHRLEISVAPASVLVLGLSGACLSLWTKSTPKAPYSSREVSTAAPNPVAACRFAASSPPRRHPQAHLCATHADRGDHSRPQEPPLRNPAALRSNETPRAPRTVAARRCPGFVHSVAAGSYRRRPGMGPEFSGQHRTAPPPSSRRCFSVKNCGATIDSK